jgi:ubiquitin carboxyl-terminal hydrolase 48
VRRQQVRTLEAKRPLYQLTFFLLSTITSKDAYMLIYTKKEFGKNVNESGAVSSTHISTPCPPVWAVDAVRLLNAAHEGACEKFESR